MPRTFVGNRQAPTTFTMSPFIFLTATPDHIPAMHVVRMSVTENALSNPLLVTERDYVEMLESKGKGWVCYAGDTLVGFAIVDVSSRNIWALFVAPGFENMGIGRSLHDQMLDWSFGQEAIEKLWLATAPGTRAERFYDIAGWTSTGITKHGEIRFEMERGFWQKN